MTAISYKVSHQEIDPPRKLVFTWILDGQGCGGSKGRPKSIREEWIGTVLKWRIEHLAENTREYFEHEGPIPTLKSSLTTKSGFDNWILIISAHCTLPYKDYGIGIVGHKNQ